MTKTLRRIEIALGSACLVAVCATDMLCRHVFWFDLIANLRVQVVIGLTVLLAGSLLFRQKRLALLTSVAWLASGVPIYWGIVGVVVPSSDAKPHPTTVMVQNIRSANTYVDGVLAHIASVDPDVFAILELTSNWDTSIRDQFESSHPYCISQPSDRGNFGIGIYSRIPFSTSRVVKWGRSVPSIEVTLAESDMRLIATHPVPPMTADNFENRNRQLREIADHVAGLPDRENTIVMGDFNLTPWSPLFRRFASDTTLRPVRNRGSFEPTWYAGPNRFPFGLVLDHIFVGEEICPQKFVVGPPVGSDHRSVSVTFQIGHSSEAID